MPSEAIEATESAATEEAEQKREIPSFADEKREIDPRSMSILDIVNASLMEYAASIKSEFSKLEQRIAALEKN